MGEDWTVVVALSRSALVRVGVAVVLVVGAGVIAWEMVTCSPPREQAEMVKRFQADPLLDTVPPDGRFAGEYARTYSCDSGFGNGGGGSLTGPGFAEVGKRYNTPAAYTYDDLRRQFDQPARAAGWVNDPGRTYPEAGHLGYCRQVGNRLVHARVGSTDRTAWIEGSPGSGIEGSCQRADALRGRGDSQDQ
ncbi:hypothetical protein JCM9533A_03160 [Catenuloplanes niger JCM 9533]